MFNLSYTPKIIKQLIVINIVVYLLDHITDGAMQKLGSLNLNHMLEHLEIWSIFTYGFMHSLYNPMHLLFNMIGLWVFGGFASLSLGKKKFLILYLSSIVFAGCVGLAFDLITQSYGKNYIGASGGIFALLVFFGLTRPNDNLWIWGLFPIKAKWLVIFAVAVDILFFGQNNIGSIIHLGGAAFGLLFFYGLKIDFSDYFSKQDGYQTELDLKEKVDLILKKISTKGMHTLTYRERKLLEKMNKKNKSNNHQKKKNFYGDDIE